VSASYEKGFKRLNELGLVARGKSKHRPRNDPSLYGGKYPFIQTGDVKHSNFYVTTYDQSYNEKGLAQSKLWEPGTLCVTIAANIAETAILGIPACFPDSIIGFVPQKNVSDVKYVKYCLDTFKIQMKLISQGTTQDNMSLEKLLSIRFKVPNFRTQRKIAAILSAYDDLIENNKRRIALLEQMAEEIYREWFVRMRFPGHENTRFEKGVPEDWEINRLDSILELCYGKALKARDRVSGNIQVYGSGGVIGTHNEALVKNSGLIIGRKGNVGSIHWSDREFFPIDTVYFVKSELPNSFLYFLLRSMNFINNDAAVPGLNRNQAYSNKFFLPPVSLIKKYAGVVDLQFEMKTNLSQQNEQLSAMREGLLSRLISGKLSVEDLDVQFPPSMQEAEA